MHFDCDFSPLKIQTLTWPHPSLFCFVMNRGLLFVQDGEARQRSWSEMLVTVLQLFLQLPDRQFQALLPVVSPSVTQLICHAQDPVLRDILAQWFQRLGNMYHFLPPALDERRQEEVKVTST